MKSPQSLDQAIIARYAGQPSRLPVDCRRAIEDAWQGEPVQLYALADLDQALRFGECWMALGPRRVALARPAAPGVWDVQHWPRSRLRSVSTTWSD